jgi:CheY-like chemotaxis protein
VPAELVLVIDDSPTILKVVQLVLTRAGFTVDTAADGEEGIARALARRPDMVLLDFLMPKMNGYQFCRALADHEALKDVPVVLMSAKGDQVGERFVKVMGIVDYITKPFSPEAITAVVQHTIEKYGRGGDPPSPLPQPSPVVDTGPASPLARKLELLSALREALVAQLCQGEAIAGLETHARSCLDEAALERLLLPFARQLLEAAEGAPALRGRLDQVPIAEVLGLLAEQQQWGVLDVERSAGAGDIREHVQVAFKQGAVELATGEGAREELRVGNFLLAQQSLSKPELDRFLAEHPLSTKPIGERLVKQQLISDTDLKQALARQAAERLYELLRWPAGTFTFHATRELPPLAIEAALGLEIDALLMEGFRRIDEWHLIEREIDDFDAVFLRDEDAVQQIGRAKLTREELAILELVNGKNSVKDVVRLSHMSSFDVSKLIFRLLSIKLVRKRVAPIAV